MSSINPNEYLNTTVVNIDDNNRTILTTSNVVTQNIINQLIQIDSNNGHITGGDLKAILDWLNDTTPDNGKLDNGAPENEKLNDGETLAAFATSLKNLVNLLKNGVVVNVLDEDGNSISTGINYVSTSLARDIETLLKSIDSVSNGAINWTNPETIATNLSVSDMKEWHSLASLNSDIRNNVAQIVGQVKIEQYTDTSGASPVTLWRAVPNAGTISIGNNNQLNGSLQAMIELLYVKTANDYLSDNMESLEQALQITQGSLDLLAGLQNVHNNVVINTVAPFTFDTRYNGVGNTSDSDNGAGANTQTIKNFDADADNYFNAAPQPSLAPGIADLYQITTDFNTAANTLRNKLFENTGNIAGLTELSNRSNYNSDGFQTALGLYIQVVSAYNQQADLVNQQLSVINKIFEAAGVTGTISLADYNDVLGNLTPASTTNGSITIPLQVAKLPQPNFQPKDLTGNIPIGSPLDNAIQSFASSLSSFVNTDNTFKLGLFKTFEDNLSFPLPTNPTIDLTAPQLVPNTSPSVYLRVETKKTYEDFGSYYKITTTVTTLSNQGFGGAAGPFSPTTTPAPITTYQFVFPMGFTPADLYGTLLSGGIPNPTNNPNITILNNAIKNGDASKGIAPYPLFDFVKKMAQNTTKLDSLITQLQADPNQNDPNSLLNALITVRADLTGAGMNSTLTGLIGATGSSFNPLDATQRAAITAFAQSWLIDNNDKVGDTSAANIGKIQNNLGFAISAAQSLNDTQKEDTRRFLYIFEEFYKSAADILSKITQIIQKIAQGINR